MVSPGIFSLKVGQHFRVRASIVTEPVVIVDALLAVGLQNVGFLHCDGLTGLTLGPIGQCVGYGLGFSLASD